MLIRKTSMPVSERQLGHKKNQTQKNVIKVIERALSIGISKHCFRLQQVEYVCYSLQRGKVL